MTSLTDVLPSRYNGNHGMIPTSPVTNIPSVIKRPQDSSVLFNSYDFPNNISSLEQNFQMFSTSLLKNKGLLVPTRLALKRQRASLKAPTIRFKPVHSDTLQMELGNREEFTSHSDQDDEEHSTLVSQNIHTSPEHNRMQSRSNDTSPLRGDTPHTVPTDISLLYREKPLFSHPVTGHFIVQYAEENGSPSPCSYVLPRKSCREKNAPSFTFGSRCLVEKKGGSRTAWQKQWFAHSNPYTTKVDFKRETAWPTPFHYPAKPTLGIQTTKVSFPAWSIATRFQTNPTIASENNPSPDTYNTTSAFQKLTATNTHITLKSRHGGTQISTNQTKGKIPGPNTYDERKFLSNKYAAPKHSFGRRIPTSLGQDPYVNTLPPIET